MKRSNILLVVLLLTLIVIAWGVQITGIYNTNAEFREKIAVADENGEKGLYQKAIYSYEEALEIRENVETRDALLDAYRSAYNNGVVLAGDYRTALQTACELHPENEEYWELFLSFCLETNSYSAAYDAYRMCERENVESVRLSELKNEILYLYKVKSKMYSRFSRSPDGFYTVFDGKYWGVINPEGEITIDAVYEYVSPISTSRDVMLKSTKGLRVTDQDSIVQANLSLEFEESRAVNGTLIPIRTSEGWKYYDYKKVEYVSGIYEDASAYTDEVAVAKIGGKWQLIGNETESEQNFDDVKLFSNGEFMYDGVMIAGVDKKYGMYDREGVRLNDFECEDADVYLGEEIAYKDNTGKWGFANLEGEVIIEPQFDEAKSFSNGLAAVRVGDSWGFINIEGDIVIDCQFLEADYFTEEGICMVSMVTGQYNLIQLRFSDK